MKDCLLNIIEQVETVPFQVTEWNMKVYIKLMTIEEQETLINDTVADDDRVYHVLVNFVLDEHGQPLWTMDDKAWFKKRKLKTIMKLFEQVKKENGLVSPDEAKKK